MTIWTPELNRKGARYLALVEAMRMDIESGRLPAGTQLPPPTATQSRERREALVAVARKWEVPILEDAIHHLLLDPASRPPLIASLAPELTHLIASPSKVVAGGLRVAFLAAPQAAMERISQQLWATSWMVAPLVAEIMCQWILDDTALATAERKRKESVRRVALLRASLPGTSLRISLSASHAQEELRLGLERVVHTLERGTHLGPAIV
jgi:DNA-binding transcriptional MocR family regulator